MLTMLLRAHYVRFGTLAVLLAFCAVAGRPAVVSGEPIKVGLLGGWYNESTGLSGEPTNEMEYEYANVVARVALARLALNVSLTDDGLLPMNSVEFVVANTFRSTVEATAAFLQLVNEHNIVAVRVPQLPQPIMMGGHDVPHIQFFQSSI